ncbi:hypothetical protein L484_006186 [Morus notabilis]|uniref:Uncharacterized protein n=1 Tax=Morus notabilis TaxID=981085 RepID=W9S1Y4_9ROSA|nr:hypothetical protein L484_006186 [Morus notabilis]
MAQPVRGLCGRKKALKDKQRSRIETVKQQGTLAMLPSSKDDTTLTKGSIPPPGKSLQKGLT